LMPRALRCNVVGVLTLNTPIASHLLAAAA
jgi:hypothetical protein